LIWENGKKRDFSFKEGFFMSGRKWSHIIVHHTGAEEKDTAQVRRYHLSLGWRDIGYHYVIERDGRIAAGRSLELGGAHCTAGGMNRKGIGVALLGNMENHPPLTAQERALLQLLHDLTGRFQIPVASILRGSRGGYGLSGALSCHAFGESGGAGVYSRGKRRG